MTFPRLDAKKRKREKMVKNTILPRLKLRGLKLNQISTPYYILIAYSNDQHKEINTFGIFDRETPTQK